jgi:hypothetical protein
MLPHNHEQLASIHIVLGMQHLLSIAAIIDGGHNEIGQSIALHRAF